MAEDGPGPRLARRVPGAAREGPTPSARRVLPDALMARMQAAVDAAHAVPDTSPEDEDQTADPATGPVPRAHAVLLRSPSAAPDLGAREVESSEVENSGVESSEVENSEVERSEIGRLLPSGAKGAAVPGRETSDWNVTVEFSRVPPDADLDDIAESYLAADPDLTDGFEESASLNPVPEAGTPGWFAGT